MTVFEIFQPGTTLELTDHDDAFALGGLLSMIESRFSEAAIALNLFQKVQQEELAELKNRGDESREDVTDAVDYRELISEYGENGRAFLVELSKRMLEAKRSRWRAGVLPQGYTSRLPFLYARAFLFSLWDIRGLLDRVVKFEGIPAAARAAVEEFDVALPMLKGLRDSSAHIDERAAGQTRGRQIATKPIQTGFINAPGGGVLVIESLVADKFTGTTANGDLAEIAVSADTMKVVQRCFQHVLNSLPWSGPGRHYPD